MESERGSTSAKRCRANMFGTLTSSLRPLELFRLAELWSAQPTQLLHNSTDRRATEVITDTRARAEASQ
jgi:hypothetical protein